MRRSHLCTQVSQFGDGIARSYSIDRERTEEEDDLLSDSRWSSSQQSI